MRTFYLRTANGLRRLARVIPVRALELLDQRDVALLGVGLRRARVDLLLPRLLLGFALCSVVSMETYRGIAVVAAGEGEGVGDWGCGVGGGVRDNH